MTSIQKGFEEEMSKFKDDYSSQMEMLQARLLTLEDHNVTVSGSFNSRRIQAPNGGSSSYGFMNMNLENLREASENIEEQGKSITRKSKRKSDGR
ncbi:uncharacterized protein LOC130988927 isoform X2 [Salvia miltiorrhiza]|uniref:uncharacterized protein LOC130988927 isoform X2 n=1 Tax=Salvia miltiorrhiza TaxID=226208 RepID=UPI0025AC2280|nr:uncharacterized protein LOC130988927 isoform X2 [Salvia miltiorrhiza]